MDKYALASYMANLVAIHNFYEGLGVEHHTMEAELQGLHAKFEAMLKGEHNEARTSGQIGNEQREKGTVVPSGQPRSSGPVGSGFRESSGREKDHE